MDKLSNAMFVVSIAFLVLSMLTGIDVFSPIAMAISVLAILRSFSKDHLQRQKELQNYYKIMRGPKAFFELARKRVTNRKTTCYFKCEQCKTMLSVPKGKGEIRVTCPKCGTVKNHRT